uniref:non-specific serine/threonine protein kinase n=1 Tax=Chenopodium quinoa TaxID=63459 RepID=A0A803LL28_CHEQI
MMVAGNGELCGSPLILTVLLMENVVLLEFVTQRTHQSAVAQRVSYQRMLMNGAKKNWTSGCVRKTSLHCLIKGGKADGFLKLEHMKVPDYADFLLAFDQDECRRNCLGNCSCLAYAYAKGIGCMLWNGSLMDLQKFSTDGADLFIRLAHSELGQMSNLKLVIAVIAVMAVVTFAAFVYYLRRWMFRRYGKKLSNKETHFAGSGVDQAEFKDLSLFEFKQLDVATSNFSVINKLGQGGFGPVYKGKLEDGQEIAVKRLSRASGQGLQEFMNEVLVISKLQHNNLVRLLSCCVQGEEKLLVYEYMPNRSLDALLFDPDSQKQLDWEKRFSIINGICRGVLYLHRDSRLKIIHRDLKPSNILLDEELNPKISDFGMARIFETKQDQGNTMRVVGTYGYMSPEYAMEGRFSEKSDVFSLGVILIEIVIGRKNSIILDYGSLSLLSYAWKMWNENGMLSLIDPTVLNPRYQGEILKCMQLGLICVQEFPEDRPTISELVSMLDVNDLMDLPQPKQPGFTQRRVYTTDEGSQSGQENGSINHVSLTVLDTSLERKEKRESVEKIGAGLASLLTESQCLTLWAADTGRSAVWQSEWKMWNENDMLSLFDPTVIDTCYQGEFLKYIQLGLLYVEEYPEHRPAISNFHFGSATTNYITHTKFLRDSEALVLSNGDFEMGFFNPPTSKNRYIGIWYTNRKFDSDASEKPILRSWKSVSNPSRGRFSLDIVPYGVPEIYTWDGDKPHWRSGPWNGNLFFGVPYLYSDVVTGFSIINDHESIISISYTIANTSLLEHLVLTHEGNLLQKFWNSSGRTWEISWQSLESECDVYGKCGPFGSCNPKKAPICSCLKGFKPSNPDEWSKENWDSGCVRKKPLHCGTTGGKADGFLKLKHMKSPDDPRWLLERNADDCKRKCLVNCSCLAYAYYSGKGCMQWSKSLVDMQQSSSFDIDLFVRLADSELGETSRWKLITAVMVIAGAATFVALCSIGWRWKSRRYGKKKRLNKCSLDDGMDLVQFQDLPLFKFKNLEVATNNFAIDNKLGRGGFGSVYKGKLEDGQHIAVKRLSKDSGQGIREFMNEVVVISKLQHKNLVRLLGCCVEGEDEKLLVYEYMPNKSLDALLFDPIQRKLLDWKKRFNIIQGICRGLLYLHRDSRLKIIHRDLKPSNILLDEELHPKISDFGMARIFGIKQDEANTSRVFGTYGYMSPEYAMEGCFSEKSDVFSFGVLLLEIVSGRRNKSFMEYESLSLLAYAWKLWNQNDMISLIDQAIFEPQFEVEISRCIQLGLLCVQELPEDRPSIPVLLMMIDANDATMDLPYPKQPGFTLRKVVSTDEVPQNVSFLFYYKLNHDGNVIEKHWDDVTQKWESNWVSIMTECDLFGKCGPFGRCNPNDSPICNCLNGFKPKNTDEWSKGNWTSGCVRMTPLQCGITGGIEDGFSRLKHMKVPHNPSFELPQDKKKCRSKCLESCSCLAYAYEDGFGCMVWKYGNIVDVQVYSADGVDLYIRLASSELDPFNAPRKTQGDTSNIKKIIVITAVVGTTTFAVFGYCLWRWMHRRYGKKATNVETQIVDSEVDQAEFKDLSLFTFKDLEVATKCFSEINKLGQGGFGPVYKGKLENGQDIAVKRLSRASGQGLLEFMNEVLVISKLQHKNLVKLLGCCVEQEEKLLVYEYMPNNSLDALLFDTHHKIHLDWKKRFNIISGICRGLVYLHRDSRLKIIHRDLKASNILLDEDFNPKISDFGMARIFENKQDQANTLRVVGTYGYMSPEYAMEGRFSEKSDLFSLGVLLLEIVSGRKNSSFLNNESLSLLTYAWRLWTENDMLSLIDPTIFDPSFNGEILKCIQLGLLCVQEFPEDRPTISVLISMLDFYDIMDLPHPTQPGFIHRKVYSTDEILQSSQEQGSVNCVSLTAFSGR